MDLQHKLEILADAAKKAFGFCAFCNGRVMLALCDVPVNKCVAPGATHTPLNASLTRNELTLNASAARHPPGRIGEPDGVASGIRWFLSPEQGWVTGQVLTVNGGLSSLQSRVDSNP